MVADGRCAECITDENCGDPAMVCRGGSCQDAGGGGGGNPVICSGGTTDCGNGRCVDTASDPNHCGSCGQQCANAEVCNVGKCTCRPGLTDCGGNCVDTNSNPNDCGGCSGNGGSGAMCQMGEICNGGSCMTGTAGDCPKDACSNNNGRVACVDFASDPLHCGDCGTRCDRDQVCVGGKCRAYAPAVSCNQCPCNDVCQRLVDSQTCCEGGGGAPICVEGDTCP